MKRIAMAASLILAVSSASAHKIGSETTGTETTAMPSVERCVTFDWTEKRECTTYDTTDHYWEVSNNCPRAVRVRWADNSHSHPIKRGEESGKPKSEKATKLKPGKTLKRDVGCVDKAELEICIDYVYPPLKEHDVSVRCDDFFD